LDIQFFLKKSLVCLTHTDNGCEPREQVNGYAIIVKSLVGCAFWDSESVLPLRLVFSFIAGYHDWLPNLIGGLS